MLKTARGSLYDPSRVYEIASRDPTAEPEDEDFDYEASDAEGLEIAREVKLFLGEDYYVEFYRFREIAIRDGEAVELEVPEFIADLTR